jgi:hypothetical protein
MPKKATVALNYKAEAPFTGQPVVLQTPGGVGNSNPRSKGSYETKTYWKGDYRH